jgi:anti-anti-sigma factor
VRLVGDIDVSNADAHGDLLCRVLDLGVGDTLIVNCHQLEFLELRGMAMMVRVHRRSVERGTWVHWAGLSPSHVRLLTLAGLDRLLSIDCTPPADQDNAPRSSDSQKRKKPSWSSPIWWK